MSRTILVKSGTAGKALFVPGLKITVEKIDY